MAETKEFLQKQLDEMKAMMESLEAENADLTAQNSDLTAKNEEAAEQLHRLRAASGIPDDLPEPKAGYCWLRIPPDPKAKEDVVVSLNLKEYTIQRGVWVEVPIGIKEIFDHRDAMLEVAQEFQRSMAQSD